MPVFRRPGGLRATLVTILVLVAVATTGCGSGRSRSGPDQPPPTQPTHADVAGEIAVSAPEPLRGPLTTLGVEFERVYPRAKVIVNVGGEPKDVVVTAGPAAMKTITDAGAAQAGPRVLARDAATEYPIVALKATGNPSGAAAFIGFVTSALGRKILTEAGFGPP